jgi:amino acid adenylation domain-containing protein
VPVRRVADLLRGDGARLDGGAAEPSDLAYVIYTSGSTGRPKGVAVRHRSVVNRLAWMQRRYPLAADDVVLQKTPISFDVSVWELFWWAVQGAGVALLPPGAERDPRAVALAVREHAVTVMHFVPSMLGSFLELARDDRGLRADVSGLRRVFCSGEALPASRVNQFNRLLTRGGARGPALVNLYGPTEATIDVTYFDCPPEGAVDRVPIGRPIDNTRLYVFGRDGDLRPAGVPGELHIGGVGVAAGYLDRPELTRERFVPDPDSARGRLYRTGDVVRWLADGNLEYLGRLDDQVKIRGNRVELGEVANALLAAPGVRDAVVVDRTTAERGVHLVAYYVADADAATDADAVSGAALREHLARTLPDFMLPSHFVALDRIPLTPNGKADRRALPAPAAAAAGSDSRPATPAERVLAEIWAEVLGGGPVAPHDDYYALGGDSLLMLRIRALAEQRGLPFDLADLIRHRTVAALARHIEHAGPRTGPDPEPPLAPFELVSAIDRARLGDAQDAFPLTRLQLGLIYHSRRNGTSAVYKDVFRYTLRIGWDEERFREAFAGLVRRHPALRSGFGLTGYTEPLQVVHAAADPCLEIADLRQSPAEAAEAEIGRHVGERRFHDYSFDKSDLYLARAHVVPSGIVLILSFHHALLDGASVANLVADLVRDYGRALGRTGEPVPEPALPSPAAYVRAERRALQSPEGSRFWSAELEGCRPLSINAFGPHEPGPAADRSPASHRVELPTDLVEDMRALARERSLPAKSLLFAVHCLTLRLLSGSDDVLTGLVIHGRPEQAWAERTLGLFLNTLPLRVDTRADSWLGVAHEAFRREQRAYPHRRRPLSAIQDDRGGALFDTAFNYVRFQQLSQALTESGAGLADFETYEQTNFSLLVNAVTDPVDARVWLRIDNDGRTVTDTQVRVFADLYTRILDRLVHHPDESPAWAFLTPAPLAPAPARPAPTVLDGFAEQAARAAHATALACGPERWSYRRLAEASAVIAANLRERGVRHGSVVGVAAERRPETIAVMLGVLSTGAAIMPLDTDYPPKRLAFMVEQANPVLIVAAERYDPLFDRSIRVLRPEQLTTRRPASPTTPATAGCADLTPDSLAAVLFTSGSTGRPKAVMMPHRTLQTVVSWQNEGATACSGVTLQYAALSFDVSLQEIFSTLCAGGTLRMVPEEVRRDLPALLRLIDRERVERIFIPYVALQQLALAAAALDLTPGSLRLIVCGGEQLRITEEIRRLCSLLPDAVLENHYGPTETHVVTRHPLTGPPGAFPDLPPVGRPVAGADVRVLDAELRPVPAGVTGELYIGGPSVALGYLGREDLTRERFVRLPGVEGLFYRSGDLGFVLPGGEIVCVGRADTQVKVRGIRVETAEVELAVRELAAHHPGIQDVAVVAQTRPGGETLLVAFLTGDASSVDAGAVRSRLRETLPDHMVPGYVQWLDRLPYTPSGKRDDAALRAVPLQAPTGHDTTAPRTERERALAEILADLLHLPTIGVHDNIFDLGGTSLTVMRLVVTIEARFGVGIPLAELIAAPTVAELAARLGAAGSKTARFDPVVPISPSGTRPPLFLVHPMGGNVICFLPLARRLPPDQPLYGLQSAGADPGTVPLGTIEEMAAGYIDALKRVQPSGPYTIGGFSFGGFVAFEMARRLLADGEQVARTLLFDTVALSPDLRERYTDDALLGWFFWELLWSVRGGASPLQGLPPDAVSTQQKFAYIAEQAVQLGVLPADAAGSLIRRLFRVYQANWYAALGYRPRGVTMDVTLLRAEQPLPDFLEAMHGAAGSLHYEATNGWKRMTTGHVRVVPVAGDHLSMMEEPRVAPLADAVAELLRAD